MRQHPIDLLPDSVRERNRAGARTTRDVTLILMAVALLVAATTHTKLSLTRIREQLRSTEERADRVLSMEATASELRERLDETRVFIDRYDRIAHPIAVGQVISTVVRELPASITLDRIDIDAGRAVGTSARSRGYEALAAPPRRELTAEVAGFAVSDEEVAELVARLESTPPFSDVSLDFSRTRQVRGHPARDFRLSFRIDLDARYETGGAPSRGKELADVQ